MKFKLGLKDEALFIRAKKGLSFQRNLRFYWRENQKVVTTKDCRFTRVRTLNNDDCSDAQG